ncbi:DUF4097 family beta strand repeat-containing protein [Thermoactinospora rubra]|uniref:DUF4097 family beta strand repeat-containing protein n=1 Tax=Thermoactinospora rubra TaxID=1088767 RepID=UPI000A109547|nr:DUF4097 family beta strand repeat-containing protein [Thermoactinospora rubra]
MPTFPTPGPITLQVSFAAGDLEVVAGDRADTDVQVRPSRGADEDYARSVQVEHAGDTVVIKAPEPAAFRLRSPSLRIVVGLPSGSAVHATTASADVSLRGPLGGVQVQTASGDVSVEQAGETAVKTASGDISIARVASLRIKTASGDVKCGTVEGDAAVTSSSGSVRIGAVHGTTEIETTSGDAELEQPGAEVSARSASGDLTLRGVRQGRVVARSASGDVTIAVAHGTAAWLDVSSLSGRVNSQLDRTEAPSGGEPTAEVSARTTSGDISIVRAGAAR